MRRSRPCTVTGSLTVWGRLSCTQMCQLRGKLGATDPHTSARFRVGASRINGTAWTQMWAASGRIAVTDRAAHSWSCAVLYWVNRFPEARDPATCAGLTCANPTALGHDRESQARGGGSLSLTRDTHATMIACMNIDTRVGPLGLPARTGLLTAHCPRRTKRPGGGLAICAAFSRRGCQATGAPSRSATTSS